MHTGTVNTATPGLAEVRWRNAYALKKIELLNFRYSIKFFHNEI